MAILSNPVSTYCITLPDAWPLYSLSNPDCTSHHFATGLVFRGMTIVGPTKADHLDIK